jgi:hypothetical protein
MAPEPPAAGAPLLVATLLGRAQLAHAKRCLRSFLSHCRESVRLVVHDDGTLDAASLADLEHAVGPFLLHARGESDAIVEGLLARHPALAEFRRTNPLALKLLDVALLEPGELHYLDADILFLRPFTGLFSPPPGCRSAFMEDTQNAYAIRSWRAWHARVRLGQRINTGVVTLRGGLDLDALEHLVQTPGFGHPPVWAEQTAWAFVAAQGSAATIDREQLTFPRRESAATVGLHFVSPVRDLLSEYDEERGAQAPTTTIRFRTAQNASPVALFFTELRRRLRRSLQG